MLIFSLMFRLIVSLFVVKQTVRWRPERSLRILQENKQNKTELCMYSMDQAGKDVFAGLKQSTEIYLILSSTHAYFFLLIYKITLNLDVTLGIAQTVKCLSTVRETWV